MFKSSKWMRVAGLIAGLVVAPAIVYSTVTFTPADQPYGYAPALAVSGFNLSTGQTAYMTWFDPDDWHGDLLAYPVNTDGSVNPAELWNSRTQLSLQDYDTGRRIVTRNGSNNVPFRWSTSPSATTLSSAQQTSIGDSTNGPKILNYVRGNRLDESQYGGTLRSRVNVLGDIIHGRPIAVGAPTASYTFDGYPTFKSNNSGRASRIYAGANDGMLHAFDAATGDEVFAYIPSMLIGNLKNLSVSPYAHTYFVDGGLAVGDAYYSGAWKTVLVGGLGAGGKGLFALDVTDAGAANETAAAAKIRWEITSSSSGYSDLGYTYGDPLIVRLNTGVWAAIVGNGYNSSSGKSTLYVINIETGALIKSLAVGSGSPGGLSTPTAIDTNSDNMIDYVYAGDVDGKLWKFDLRNFDPANWTAPATPLYDAGPNTSIVSAPDVAGHPLGGFMVYFGTGRLFTQTQAADTAAQNYAYGIWDGAPVANTALLDQTLTSQSYGSQQVRVSSAKQINWSDAARTLHKGWRTALPVGEHIVTSGYVRDGRYQFTSVNTSIPNAVKPDGANWLVELDYLNGGTDGKVIFDLNADANFNDSDRVTGSGTPEVANGNTVPVGIYLGPGLYSAPLLALVSSTLSTTLFNYNPFVNPGSRGSGTVGDAGVAGGHFDLDLFFDNGTGIGGGFFGGGIASKYHTHKYDDVFDVVGVNLEYPSDSDYKLVGSADNNANGAGNITTSTRFFVLVSNADLSPAVTMTVGGVDYLAYQYPNRIDSSKTIYTSATANTLQFKMPTDAFTVKDWGTGVARPGLLPSAPQCIMANNDDRLPANATNEKTERVSVGALTIWIVKDTAPASAIKLNIQGHPEMGYKITDNRYVLKKYAVYWHNGRSGSSPPCYDENDWVQNPSYEPPETVASQTPAAGSRDPKGNLGATVVSTNTASTTVSGIVVTTVTTNYSDGSRVEVVTAVDSRGRSVACPPGYNCGTHFYAPPAGGGGAPPGQSSSGTVGSAPPPRTGYNQSRKSGKTGRVAWHEIIKP